MGLLVLPLAAVSVSTFVLDCCAIAIELHKNEAHTNTATRNAFFIIPSKVKGQPRCHTVETALSEVQERQSLVAHHALDRFKRAVVDVPQRRSVFVYVRRNKWILARNLFDRDCVEIRIAG